MRSLIVSLLFVVISFLFYSCASAPAKIVVAKYGDNEITLDEFHEVYNKSAGTADKSEQNSFDNMKNFLDLYVNFKMKLRDAFVRGLDTDPDIINELTSYKMQIGKTYIFEKDLINPGIHQLYERRKNEFRVSHLMVSTDSLSPAAAEIFAKELIARIQKGEKFEDLVKLYSDDTASKNKGGDIYYFTAGQFLPEFDIAIYNTPVGEIYPAPIRSRGGYHIVKVTEKRERVPEIRARHILVRTIRNEETGLVDTAEAFVKITKILDEINNGKDFAKAAEEYSDDKASAVKGGDLGFFSRRRTVKEFDEVAYNLDINEISGIVRTQFGYHIIQLLEKRPIPSFEQEEDELKKLYNKNLYHLDYNNYVENLKQEFNFVLNEPSKEYILGLADSIVIGKDYFESDFQKEAGKVRLFTINNREFIFDDMMYKFINEQKLDNKLLDGRLYDALVKSFSEEILFDMKSVNLDKDDPHFAKLMEDYQNGILIFKLHEDEVWGKVSGDESVLLDYYKEHRNEFTWDRKVSFSEIMTRKDSLATKYYEMLKEGILFDSLAAKYTERKGFKEKAGRWELMEVGNNRLAVKASTLKPGEFSEPFNIDGAWSIIRLNSVITSTLKTFEEAKPEIATILQESESKRLENEYIDKLKERYHPEIYYDALKNISN